MLPSSEKISNEDQSALRSIVLACVRSLATHVGDSLHLLEALGGIVGKLPGPAPLSTAMLECVLAAALAVQSFQGKVGPCSSGQPSGAAECSDAECSGEGEAHRPALPAWCLLPVAVFMMVPCGTLLVAAQVSCVRQFQPGVTLHSLPWCRAAGQRDETYTSSAEQHSSCWPGSCKQLTRLPLPDPVCSPAGALPAQPHLPAGLPAAVPGGDDAVGAPAAPAGKRHPGHPAAGGVRRSAGCSGAGPAVCHLAPGEQH